MIRAQFAIGRRYSAPADLHATLTIDAGRWPEPPRNALAEIRAWLLVTRYVLHVQRHPVASRHIDNARKGV